MNTLESTSFNGFWPNLVHTYTLGESGTLLIFKVRGQGYQVKFLPRNILVNTRINILQWILTKLGTYFVLKRIWNPIDFQDHRIKFLGKGIRHALHCSCFTVVFDSTKQIHTYRPLNLWQFLWIRLFLSRFSIKLLKPKISKWSWEGKKYANISWWWNELIN